jgi:hypothetical protein
MQQRLVRWGIIDGQRAAVSKTLSEHVSDYQAHLLAKGGTSHHANLTAGRLRQLFDLAA